jgi:hypothetical protein
MDADETVARSAIMQGSPTPTDKPLNGEHNAVVFAHRDTDG